MRATRCIQTAVVFGTLLVAKLAIAGMPAVLPTGWTKDNAPKWMHIPSDDTASWPYLQAFSFFVVTLLLSALAVQGLIGALHRDVAWIPKLTFGRSLSLVVLWGLLFVIVLTMISGARELMTPGAWRKQGWTYQLSDASNAPSDPRAERKRSLEQLRVSLWQFAATHEGRFPSREELVVDEVVWDIPGHAGLQFRQVPNRSADERGRLLIYEPDFDGDERLVLLTNGMIGTMRTSEIRRALSENDDE